MSEKLYEVKNRYGRTLDRPSVTKAYFEQHLRELGFSIVETPPKKQRRSPKKDAELINQKTN